MSIKTCPFMSISIVVRNKSNLNGEEYDSVEFVPQTCLREGCACWVEENKVPGKRIGMKAHCGLVKY